MDVDGGGLHHDGLRNTFSHVERVGCGNCLHRSADGACACIGDFDGSVGNGWKQDGGCNDHDYASSAGRSGGESDERVGADGTDAECHSYGDERSAEQGRDVDVDGRGLCGSNLRNTVGGFERVGRGDYLYGSGERAGACDCDADDSVSGGREQDRGHHDHSDTAATCGRGGESDERVGADGIDAECHGYGDARSAE